MEKDEFEEEEREEENSNEDDVSEDELDIPFEEYDRSDVEPPVDRPQITVNNDAEEVLNGIYNRIEHYEGEKLRQRTLKLKSLIDVTYFELSGLLHKIRTHEEYKNFEKPNGETFDEWLEYVNEELGFKERKAQYLIRIWEKFRIELDLTAKDVAEVPWTKLKELIPVVEQENHQKWIQKAKNLTRKELRSEVQEAKTGEEQETPARIGFQVYENQQKTIEEALELASEMANSDKRGHLIDLICQHFLANHIRDVDKQLEFFISRLENVYDIRIWFEKQA